MRRKKPISQPYDPTISRPEPDAILNFSRVFKYIFLKDITIHPKTPHNILESLAICRLHLQTGEMVSQDGIKLFLDMHPLHLTNGEDNQYYCYAGLRGLQLAQSYLAPNDNIPAIILHPSPEDISDLVLLDTLLCNLVYGLDNKAWDLDILRLWNSMGPEQLMTFFPGLNNKSALARHLGTDRRRLSNSAEQPTPSLELEQFPADGK
ncbi:MAG: hypothetical protein AB1568_04865 [Thermodesulfobacteriota bacterium]